MDYKIEFAKENDNNEIIELLHKCFIKPNGFFQKLVPVLYKEDKNPSKNHLVIRVDNRIIATIAIMKNTLFIDDKEYSFLILGSLGVDPDFRNQGIMGLFFDYILNNYNAVDFFVLSGNYDRYQRFGFHPSAKISKIKYIPNNLNNFDFTLLNQECPSLINLYNKKAYKVHREYFYDTLNQSMFIPYLIKKENDILGYLIYNSNANLIEEVILEDYSIINDVCMEFARDINKEVYLKLCINTNEYSSYIDPNNIKEEYVERTLYKIINKDINEIHIPKSDMI